MDEAMRAWREQGFLVRRGVFDRQRCERLRAIAEGVWSRCMIRDAVSGRPGGDAGATTMFHCNHPDYFRAAPAERIDLLESGCHPRILDMAREIHGEDPLFYCQSLWFNPTANGRDGHWHRDTQFVHPDEAEERARFDAYAREFGNGVQIQIALTRSDDCEFVPGSHLRWDTPEENRIRRADGQRNWTANDMPGAMRLALEPGDAVAFNPLGLHRGRYHVDKLRRTFMVTVTRSSRPESNPFTRQPWFLEPGYLDGLSPQATAWYRRFIAAYRESWSLDAPAVDPVTGMSNAPAVALDARAAR